MKNLGKIIRNISDVNLLRCRENVWYSGQIVVLGSNPNKATIVTVVDIQPTYRRVKV